MTAELEGLSETGDIISHRGMTFDILLRDHCPGGQVPYVLRTQPKRGKARYYALMRNVPNPEMLFGVALGDGRMALLPGWFSDAAGKLVSRG